MKTRGTARRKPESNVETPLNKQLIIRFPLDISERVHENINNDLNLSVHFIDKHKAEVEIFNEQFDAILVRLPTLVESLRTTDGIHLFKSGEISDILLVYREGEFPEGISEDYIYSHGITPPTKDIVMKRRSKQEALAISNHESYLSDVEYWDLAELQIAALMSKERDMKKNQKCEIFEEPDIDPVILEKILRKNGHIEFEGYSGKVISQEEVDEFEIDLENLQQYILTNDVSDDNDHEATENELYQETNIFDQTDEPSNSNDSNLTQNLHQSQDQNKDQIQSNQVDDMKETTNSLFPTQNSDFMDNLFNSRTSRAKNHQNMENTKNCIQEKSSTDSFSQMSKSSSGINLQNSPFGDDLLNAKYVDTFEDNPDFFDFGNHEHEDEEEEEEEEESPDQAEFQNLTTKKDSLVTQLEVCRGQLIRVGDNENMRQKINTRISSLEKNIAEIEEKIADLLK
ncbi:hypothetical protein TRFO_13531 [Tritrichomonas foetus]|uniref:TAFII55 protein conserved region domain-containing protein n=1 Tax=Tritrichomonas foetus TaxID=1144522 RepID=A0A1J4KXS5_9EUKA|nr:hypothetical protein TRFO_13531 [Tritrichomonas foetus]|eukprot:OHT16039.1 hypothetical protein TRFO_13531 [Tritrichomonas foetus]